MFIQHDYAQRGYEIILNNFRVQELSVPLNDHAPTHRKPPLSISASYCSTCRQADSPYDSHVPLDVL